MQNYHVRFSYNRNIIFLEIVKLLQVGTLCITRYAKDAIVSACHRTGNGQEHNIIWGAGQEQDTIFHLRVTACREQGSHCHDERLAWEQTKSELKSLFLWLTMCTDRKQPLNLSNAHACV